MRPRTSPTSLTSPSPARELVTVVVAAAAATQVKTWAEAVLQPAAERLLPPARGEKDRLGADPGDQPERMPPAELTDRVLTGLGGDPLSDDQRETSSQVVHWVMGVGAGAAYGLLAHRVDGVRRGRGLAFGAALFAGTHASLLPALGVQAPLSRVPRAWWVWEAGSHLVYGVAVDTVLRVADGLAER